VRVAIEDEMEVFQGGSWTVRGSVALGDAKSEGVEVSEFDGRVVRREAGDDEIVEVGIGKGLAGREVQGKDFSTEEALGGQTEPLSRGSGEDSLVKVA